MAKVIHAPRYTQSGVSVDDNPIGDAPMCNVNSQTPRIAQPGDKVGCSACLNLLWDRPQWLHHLMGAGYLFPEGRKPSRARRRKKDPRQLDFADYLDGKVD